MDHDVDVVIAGAGPTGLALACELALAKVRVALLERLPQRPGYCRAFNLNAGSLELLERRGLAGRFVAEGYPVPFTSFAGLAAPLDLSCLETRHPYVLGIPQTRTEELLEGRARELGVMVQWGREVVGLEQEENGVTVTARGAEDSYRLRAAYLAGCDGGRSTVRKLAGIAFPGTPSTRWALLGDVEMPGPDALPPGPHQGPGGSVFVIPRPGYFRVIVADPDPPLEKDVPVALEQLQEVVSQALGREVEMAAPRWLTRFGNAARQAEQYVRGRVVLAGDGAHIHPPAGAQGLNVGLQDAFNLGWKLAGCVHGWAPNSLLDTYHTERHAVGARVLMNTKAQELLGETGGPCEPVRLLLGELASLEPVRRHLAEAVTGLSTRYGVWEKGAHPLLGRLMPDLPLQIEGRQSRVSELLYGGRGVLLDLTGAGDFAPLAAGWADRVDVVTALCPESGDLSAVLIRPDGYTAWVAMDGEEPEGLRESLAAWFGREGDTTDAADIRNSGIGSPARSTPKVEAGRSVRER